MIIYNVTIKIEEAIAEEWLLWMLQVHIPEVMATGCFKEYRVFKVLVDDTDGLTYSIQYLSENMTQYEHYKQVHAPALQKAHTDKYTGRFVAFRTMLEQLIPSNELC